MESKKVLLKENVLLLQGPVGPFFNRFGKFLTKQGHVVHKINLHLGEHIFYPKNAHFYNGSPQDWPSFIRCFLLENNINHVFCLGKHKFYNKVALDLCLANNIDFFVFEEGLIRPNFITLEKLSTHSFFPRNVNDITRLEATDDIKIHNNTSLLKKINLAYNRYLQWQWTLIYGIGLVINQFYNPHYCHHLPYKGYYNFYKWALVIARLFFAEYTPFKNMINNFWFKRNKKKYYMVALQISTDSSVVYNKNINSMYDFIEKVLVSFSKFAPKDSLIVLKHHPYDKGWNNYKSYIKKLAQELQIEGRVKYIFNGSLSRILKNAKGCVVLNSTLGMTAIEFGIPTIALSEEAYYNYEGLIYQKGINNFWNDLQPPNPFIFNSLYQQLIHTSQISGSFYSGQIELTKKFQANYSLNKMNNIPTRYASKKTSEIQVN